MSQNKYVHRGFKIGVAIYVYQNPTSIKSILKMTNRLFQQFEPDPPKTIVQEIIDKSKIDQHGLQSGLRAFVVSCCSNMGNSIANYIKKKVTGDSDNPIRLTRDEILDLWDQADD